LQSVLGRKPFLITIKEKINKSTLISYEINENKKIRKNTSDILTVDELVKRISNHYQIKISDLKQRGHRNQENRLRNLAIYYAGRYKGFSNEEIARCFGDISHSGVSQIKRRTHHKIATKKSMMQEVLDLEEIIE